jgi:hypothetical protein
MLIWNFTIYATLKTAENPGSVTVLELVVLADFSEGSYDRFAECLPDPICIIWLNAGVCHLPVQCMTS